MSGEGAGGEEGSERVKTIGCELSKENFKMPPRVDGEEAESAFKCEQTLTRREHWRVERKNQTR